MNLYIKEFSTYRSDKEDVDIKKQLKQHYKQDVRRKDAFIHLAMFGILRLKDKIDIDLYTELYMTSGVGNIDIIQKVYEYVTVQKQCIMPFDFINMVGNTTSYYVCDSVGLKGKSIFQISDNFTFINSLVSVYASISTSKKDAIIGSIDLISESENIIKKVLGITEKTKIVSSVNYQYVSLTSKDALAKLEFDTKIYTLDEVKNHINDLNYQIVASIRCSKLDVDKDSVFFETMPSWAINNAISKSKNIIFIDCFEDKYKIIKLKNEI
ncbi:hypothetical protein [Sulfurimonas sp.]|uniref:hypothetical protein n=1 Tax=Sulfurimonas sp. TaxID=2022749 RepID=UPI002AB0DDA4|nr:hypothetical protein [Sulfurimonas sp.]